MIQLEQRDFITISKILSKYPYNFFIYGSRTKVRAKPFSDLDLCIMDSIPLSILGDIKNDFEESDLPFTVDIVRWDTLKQDFKERIQSDLIPFPRSL